ncbi:MULTISPECIES: FitA-like ribbon-helix-helix domain-containing protein [Pseudomonas syringae group]|uniref:HTH cro/C1-type domain-containing protein n=1 Tax=Pseudomonas syringae TaxID=317 RepID=A0A2K4X3T5_PSESX|nr:MULTISPECIES: hypothetical protein [Pseudomonas syringae group]AVB17715.1 hypothetical protein BKM19_030670 [Pseudomonas amygdali pv. morsprunorum]KWS60328.1 hypothetical protein AL056_21965 [Pseudomonas amygdali pv. morsprunorum]KWS66028.1 hypothetical protein AL054_01325 [Pseudomonas amygdali pv. morsprunorum]PHX28653.1 hypothetical protein AO282_15755 [Pseudomonas amygdali pv. morsprunorum]POC81868.1 hypothetical protein BKM08_27640 [Pseudomonas amygdali pv. morsprunorum]
MFSNDNQNGKINIRNLSADVLRALNVLAEQHDRSLEAEARQALRAWVQPQIENEIRTTRAAAIGQRLRYLQEEIDRARYGGSPASPSRVAEALAWPRAQSVEDWFAGESEPTFEELSQLSDLFGCSRSWLLHGEGTPYSAIYQRIPENAFAGADFLLASSEAGVQPRLYLLRSKSKAGEFCYVRSYSDWHAQTFSTPYHISDVIGSGGEASLAALSLVFESLYRRWTRGDATDTSIQAFLVDDADFSSLLAGKRHPLSIIRDQDKSCWWEDFWDAAQSSKQNYWPGWASITAHIQSVVDGRPSLKAQREKLRGNPQYANDEE